jgi:DNA polymerase III subunit gamma/tau
MPPAAKLDEPNGVDLDIKYRPRRLEDVVGQPTAVATIRGFAHCPRAVMLHGPTGSGKTTMSRIITDRYQVSQFDCHEINCGMVESAVDLVRGINREMTSAPMVGDRLAWVLDEVQIFSKSKQAQETLLEPLEKGPPHVLFILCTTDPKRLLPAIRGRCVDIELKPLSQPELELLVKRIAKAESIPLDQRVVDKITHNANGAARNAVKLLQKVMGITDPEKQLAAIGGMVGGDVDEFGLVKALLPWKGIPNWTAVAAVLVAVKEAESEPEGLRMMILASARSMLVNLKAENAPLASRLIRYLAEPLYDKTSGHALLANACFQACHAK